MPTYVISCSPGLLDHESKARLAGAITTIHREETGAAALFARVVFRGIEPTDCFLGARELSTPHCFIDARIRAGRSISVQGRLTARIVEATAAILGIPRPAVWLYLAELPPYAMIEYGHGLPQPGEEAAWLDGLSDADRAFIRRSTET